MIKMLCVIEKQRMRARAQRRHLLSGALLAALFAMVCSAGYLVMQNAQADAQNSYWERTGNADIIAILPHDSKEADSLKDAADSFSNACLSDAGVKVNSEDEGSTVAVYGNIAAIDQMFRLGVSENVSEIGLVVNQEFLDHFACSVGEVVALNGINYRIDALSSKVSTLFGGAKEPLVVINSAEKTPDDASTIVFANFSHNRADVDEAMRNLESQNVSALNLCEGANAIEKEFSNLSSILSILLVVMAAIYLMLNYTMRLVEMKTESAYWKSMRIVGMSRRAMFGSMLFEGALFSFGGGIVGCAVGSVAAFITCVLTDTSFTVWALSPIALTMILILVVAISSVSTFAIVLRTRGSTSLDVFSQKQREHRPEKKALRTLPLIVGIVLIAAVGLGMLYYAPSEKTIAVAYYSALLGATILALILLSMACSEIAGKLLARSRSKTMRLAAYASRVGGVPLSRIAISLALCLSMAGMLLNFTYSFRSWARDLANSQLSLDMRAEAENTNLGQESINSMVSDDTLASKSVYYVSVGSVGATPAYIMAEAPESNGSLNEVYQSSVSFSQLGLDDVVMTKHLLSTLGLKVGDRVNVVLGGKEAELNVVSAIETQDYSSCLAVVSPHKYPSDAYSKICMNAKFTSDTQSVGSLREQFPPSSVAIVSKNDLSSQWQSSIVSGVELLLGAVALIFFVLLSMLSNTICNFLQERKRDFAILRTMGMSGRGIVRMLFAELLVCQLPAACLALILTPLVSFAFLELSALSSGYSVNFQMDYLGCFGVWAATIALVAAMAAVLFVKQKNESPIDSLVVS